MDGEEKTKQDEFCWLEKLQLKEILRDPSGFKLT